MAGVWEEALVEEAIYLIAHLAQSEQHLMEIEGETKLEDLMPIIDGLRNKRKMVGGCAIFSPEDRRRKGKGRIPHKA